METMSHCDTHGQYHSSGFWMCPGLVVFNLALGAPNPFETRPLHSLLSPLQIPVCLDSTHPDQNFQSERRSDQRLCRDFCNNRWHLSLAIIIMLSVHQTSLPSSSVVTLALEVIPQNPIITTFILNPQVYYKAVHVSIQMVEPLSPLEADFRAAY